MSKTKGLYYSKAIATCDDCKSMIVGHFKVKKDEVNIELCKKCAVKIPSIAMWVNTALNKMTKTYVVKGTYLRRKFNGNHFKLKYNDPLLALLRELKTNGFKVPMFGGGTRQIAITTKRKLTEDDVDQSFTMKVKLCYWSDIRSNKKGYRIVPV